MTWETETVYSGMWQGLGGEEGWGLGVRTNPTWDVNIEVMEIKLGWENLEDCQTANLLFWKSPPKDAGVVKFSHDRMYRECTFNKVSKKFLAFFSFLT